jgi:WhiB family redox-sensing transcriptional regulator
MDMKTRNHAQHPTTTRTGSRWRSRAACRDVDPELFFPVGKSGPALLQIAEAKAVCRRCPVRDACLADALERIPDGIAGGLTEDERRTLHRTGRGRGVQA